MLDWNGWEYSQTSATEFFRCIINEKMGQGAYRNVYTTKLNPDVVIKFERNGGDFHNVNEYHVWQSAKCNKDIAKWFAPCLWISPCGVVLVQKKTKPPVKLPAMLPTFLTDFRKSNYGMLDGKFVCHDYGFYGTVDHHGLYTKRMKKVDWYKDEE